MNLTPKAIKLLDLVFYHNHHMLLFYNRCMWQWLSRSEKVESGVCLCLSSPKGSKHGCNATHTHTQSTSFYAPREVVVWAERMHFDPLTPASWHQPLSRTSTNERWLLQRVVGNRGSLVQLMRSPWHTNHEWLGCLYVVVHCCRLLMFALLSLWCVFSIENSRTLHTHTLSVRYNRSTP